MELATINQSINQSINQFISRHSTEARATVRLCRIKEKCLKADLKCVNGWSSLTVQWKRVPKSRSSNRETTSSSYLLLGSHDFDCWACSVVLLCTKSEVDILQLFSVSGVCGAGLYMMSVMTLTSLSVIMAVLVINCYNGGQLSRRAPLWARTLVLGSLSRLLRMSHNTDQLAAELRLVDTLCVQIFALKKYSS